MDDKNLMENILLLEKGVCDLFLHGTIESPTDNVHQAFSTALNNALGMQDMIYDKMAAKGWLPHRAGRAEQGELREAEIQRSVSPIRRKKAQAMPALFSCAASVPERQFSAQK